MATAEEHKDHAFSGNMSAKDVGNWVSTPPNPGKPGAGGLGMPQYRAAFEQNHIDGECLKTLDKEDLVDLGINSVGHRIKILAAIASIQQVAAIEHRNKVLLQFTEFCKSKSFVCYWLGYGACGGKRDPG